MYQRRSPSRSPPKACLPKIIRLLKLTKNDVKLLNLADSGPFIKAEKKLGSNKLLVFLKIMKGDARGVIF
ncbi:hypothetical protein BpHYR1_043698 [Brachionus plicatilis]|uniref:Uncharacterized protein n=1 Tax=Brachionus plicatilis TaxID=10195 RepID=A0A3M7RN46_BRAPC|nr:hypothetical protein BpHYR1_043698 [Brachionus plicatilis]